MGFSEEKLLLSVKTPLQTDGNLPRCIGSSGHWRSLRCLGPPANEKKINARLVNLTVNMRYKNDKKISNLSSPDSFFSSSKCIKIRFLPRGAYDALRRSPRPPSRLGRGIAPPHSPSPRRRRRASLIRRLRRLYSQAPSTQNAGYASG